LTPFQNQSEKTNAYICIVTDRIADWQYCKLMGRITHNIWKYFIALLKLLKRHQFGKKLWFRMWKVLFWGMFFFKACYIEWSIVWSQAESCSHSCTCQRVFGILVVLMAMRIISTLLIYAQSFSASKLVFCEFYFLSLQKGEHKFTAQTLSCSSGKHPPMYFMLKHDDWRNLPMPDSVWFLILKGFVSMRKDWRNV